MSKTENSKPENFLTRWSSRKLANRSPSARQDAERAPRDASGAIENGAVAKTGKDDDAKDSQPFDVSQLPPLDSIGADTDITAFLHRDAPPELTRAALRRPVRHVWLWPYQRRRSRAPRRQSHRGLAQGRAGGPNKGSVGERKKISACEHKRATHGTA